MGPYLIIPRKIPGVADLSTRSSCVMKHDRKSRTAVPGDHAACIQEAHCFEVGPQSYLEEAERLDRRA